MSYLAEVHAGCFVHVFKNADDANHGRGIDAFAQSFVVEADIATGDGNFKLFARFGDAVDHLRELPHDVRLLRVAEVEAVGCADRRSSRASHVARGFGDGVHRTQARIEIAPASVAIERHGEAALRSFDTDHPGIARAGTFHGIGLHHVIVLLPHPAFAADIWTGEQTLQIGRQVGGSAEMNIFRHLARDGRLPAFQWAVVYGSIVGKRLVRNLGDHVAVLEHPHPGIIGDAAHFNGIEPPLLEDAEDFVLAAFLRHQ